MNFENFFVKLVLTCFTIMMLSGTAGVVLVVIRAFISTFKGAPIG